MKTVKDIPEKFIIPIDKFKIGMGPAEVLDTEGKYLILRENHVIDETLYDVCGCGVLDDEFIEKVISLFDSEYFAEVAEWNQFAIDHKLLIDEVPAYQRYLESCEGKPDTAAVWRNSELNEKWNTEGKEYITAPKQGYFDSLAEWIALGEYRLGVFIN